MEEKTLVGRLIERDLARAVREPEVFWWQQSGPNAADELTQKIRAIMAERGMTYCDAFSEAQRQNPDLASKYQDTINFRRPTRR